MSHAHWAWRDTYLKTQNYYKTKYEKINSSGLINAEDVDNVKTDKADLETFKKISSV